MRNVQADGRGHAHEPAALTALLHLEPDQQVVSIAPGDEREVTAGTALLRRQRQVPRILPMNVTDVGDEITSLSRWMAASAGAPGSVGAV